MDPFEKGKLLLNTDDLKIVQQEHGPKIEQLSKIIEMLLARIKVLETEFKQVKNEHGKSIKELEFKIAIIDNMTENGHLLWKIQCYSKRKQEAIDNKVLAINSAPCFTSKYGYKYCFRFYPMGDGMGKGTHLTLFLVLLKSEYDSMLQWPFTKKAVVTLINQKDRAHDVVKVLIPDTTLPSFQKPKKDTNIATGFPTFVALERLKEALS